MRIPHYRDDCDSFLSRRSFDIFCAGMLGLVVLIAVAMFTGHAKYIPPKHDPTPRAALSQRLPPPAVTSNLTAVLSCSLHNTGCAKELLGMMNQARLSVGSPMLRIDWTLAHHSDACVSASDHAKHLVKVIHSLDQFGTYAHDQFYESCAARFGLASQNVGEYYGSKEFALIGDFQDMMAEGNQPLGDCLYGHDCSITYRGFSRVGIAFAYSSEIGGWLIVEDFAA